MALSPAVLVMDGGEVTAGRRTAYFAYGKFDVVLPEGREQVETDSRLQNGYIARAAEFAEMGRFDFGFVRADATVDLSTGTSDLESAIDTANNTVQGDMYFERDVGPEGLGQWRPGVDFTVDDLVWAQFWRARIRQPVTAINYVASGVDGPAGKRVHIGGQLVSDARARQRSNLEIRRELERNKRDLARVSGAAARALDAASVAVVSSRVEFAVAESDSVAPVSGWGVSQPSAGPGVWVWQRQVTEFGDGRVEYGTPWVLTSEAGPAGPAGPAGRDGLPGKDGVGLKSTTVSYAVSASGTTAPKSGWQASPPSAGPGQFVWTRTVWAYTDGATETGYSVGKIGETGATGADGVPGKDGTTLVSTTITYAASASGTKAPSSGWQASPPAASPGQFVWTRSVWEYSDGTTETGYSVGKIGNTGAQGPKGDKGDPGADGVPGKNGLGVKSTTVTYAAAASGTTAPLSGWAAQPPAASPGQFVWTRMVLAYTDNSTETVYSVGKIGDTGAQGPKGATGARGATGASGKDGLPGKDGVGLKSTAVTYAVSTSGTKAPSSGWQASPPVAKGGQYMWTRFIWTYTDNTTETGYSIGKIGDVGSKGDTGAQGPKGATGAAGVSVKTVTRFWRWAATKPGTPTGTANPSGWSTTQPAYVVGQKLWTTIRTVMSNNTATWSPVTEEATVSAATAIAQASADGKNRIWYSATAPGSSKGEQAGDTWFRYSGAKIIGQWRWTGSAWQAQTIDNQVIANLDAGKITSGTIDAQRIGAASITAKHLLVSPGNLIANGSLVQGGAGWDSSLAFHEVASQTMPPNGRYLMTKAGQGTIAAHGFDNWFDVTPGGQYAFEMWVYSRDGTSNLYVECRNQDGEHAGTAGPVVNPGDTPTGGSIYFIQNRSLSRGWVKYSCVYTMGATTTRARLGSFYFNHSNGAAQNDQIGIAGISLRPMTDASLIVDGSVTAKAIAANSISAQKLQITPGNLFPDPHFQDPCWDSRPGIIWKSSNNGGELRITATGAQTGVYYQPAGLVDKSMTLEGGAAYRLTANVYMPNAINPKNLAIYMRYRHTDGSIKIQALGNLVGATGTKVSALNFTAPTTMKDGTCTLGFYLEKANADGQGIISVWDVQLVRAADASLIVDGSIQGRHIQANSINGDRIVAGTLDAKAIKAGTITATQVNAEDILLTKDGDASLKGQWDDMSAALQLLQAGQMTLSDRLHNHASSKRGFLVYDNGLKGSDYAKSLFQMNAARVEATGSWKGRAVLVITKRATGSSGSASEVGISYQEIDVLSRIISSHIPSGGQALLLYEVDPVEPDSYLLIPAENWSMTRSTWATVPNMSVTMPDGTESVAVSGTIYFTAVNRGSTYGIRVLVGGKEVRKWTSTRFGPLGPLGEKTWKYSFSHSGDAKAGQKVEIQTYSSAPNSNQRVVTDATIVLVTAYTSV